MSTTLKNVTKALALVLALVMVLGVVVPTLANAEETTEAEVTLGERKEDENGNPAIQVILNMDGKDVDVVDTVEVTAKSAEGKTAQVTFNIPADTEAKTLDLTGITGEVSFNAVAKDAANKEVEVNFALPGNIYVNDYVNTNTVEEFTVRLINTEDSGHIDVDTIINSTRFDQVNVVSYDSQYAKVNPANVNNVTYTNESNEIKFDLDVADTANQGLNYYIQLVDNDAANEAEKYVFYKLFELKNNGTIYRFDEEKDVDVTVEENRLFDVFLNLNKPEGAKYIKVQHDGKGLAGYRLQAQIVKNGQAIKNLGLVTGDASKKDGLLRYDHALDIVEGVNYDEAVPGNPFSTGYVDVTTVKGTYHLKEGEIVRFLPVKATGQDKFYDEDMTLDFNFWTLGGLNGATHTSLPQVIKAGYYNKVDNPFVIDYGMTEYELNIRAFTKDLVKEQPVEGATFSVHKLALDENGEITLGDKVETAKTDEFGNIKTTLPVEDTKIVFNAVTGLKEIEIPYILVQEDGGVDGSVIPYDGYIFLSGDYNVANGVNTSLAPEVSVDFNTAENIFKVEVENTRDGIQRYYGEDIFEDAVEVAKASYPNGLVKEDGYKNVVIASAVDGKLTDALVAGSVANLYKAPLLVVEEDNIPEVVEKYLDGQDATRAIIVGGPNTISDEVATKLETLTGTVKRYAGVNRFDTAVLVAKDVLAKSGNSEVILANGQSDEKFADALAVSAAAGKHEYPILLTDSDKLVECTADFLADNSIKTVYVVGGENTIDEQVARDVNNMATVTTVDRIAGETRFETSVEIAKAFFPEELKKAVFVNGDNNVQALLAGPFGAVKNAPVILVGNDVPEVVAEYLNDANIETGYIIGDLEDVPHEVRVELAKEMNK